MLLQVLGTLYLFGLGVTYLAAEWYMVCPPNPSLTKIRRRWFVANYDKWVGLYEHPGLESLGYMDKAAYWFPLPCVGIKFYREIK
jgi:hypothetical protein